MVFLSLLPAGIYQAYHSISTGLWFARSPEIQLVPPAIATKARPFVDDFAQASAYAVFAMHFAGKPEPHAQLFSARCERASDPYCGTPLGVEAAWCPNGIDVPGVAATPETTIRPMEL